MWRCPPLPATWGQPILQRIGPSKKENADDVKYMVFVKAELCMYSTPLFTCMCIAIHVYNVRNTHATWSVPLVCLCASCVPCACQCALSRFGPLVHDELNPGSSLQRVHRQYNKRSMPALGSRLIFMWMMLLCCWLGRYYCWPKWHDSC